jgi:hypothetical protein
MNNKAAKIKDPGGVPERWVAAAGVFAACVPQEESRKSSNPGGVPVNGQGRPGSSLAGYLWTFDEAT